MKQDLIERIGKTLPLKQDEIEHFLGEFNILKLKKGEHFILEGKKCRKIGFIISGSMYCYYNVNGEKAIDEFSLENEYIADYVSFLTDSPAEKSIECLEDTILAVLDFEKLQKLYTQSPKYEKVGRLIAEGLFLNWHQKAKSLMLDNAEKRYIKLLDKRPDLPQRVPQYLIASYLNVKPETLSRIRKKITK